MSLPKVTRTTAHVRPDPTRTILKRFTPSAHVVADGSSRLERVLARILALSEVEVASTLAHVLSRFSARHRDLRSALDGNFAAVAGLIDEAGDLSAERRLLIGAYCTNEYAVEAAALTNPSMVLAPDQGGLSEGALRFVLSLRAIGEGHISSIQFRTGVIDASGQVQLEPPSRYVGTARHRAPLYEKPLFETKLKELQAHTEIAARVLDGLNERFSLRELEVEIQRIDEQYRESADVISATRTLHWLASSNYESSFADDSELSERALFPAGPTESNGMEDARFVRFSHDDGKVSYFATYTAFDGFRILPQLIETDSFVNFRIATLNGAAATNKGIALFPRKIDGCYVALARLDNENNFLMRSDNVRFWHEGTIIQRPARAWESVHIGNCGSPLETEAGWLVITHGVGALRQYSLGAILLDKDDPARVLGHLREPLLEPAEDERDGYVPNVVYSCGSMIAGELLVVPYGVSDTGARIATVVVADLLEALTASA
jgi:predicted GH43/DUF377 family glycosyl hydrolase